MPQSSSPEEKFLENLSRIDRIAVAVARHRGIVGADADDMVSMVRAKFVETAYAPFVQFREEASLDTYLRVVISSWVKDHIIARDGRYRPSAAALRGGPVMIKLERLISKSGCSVDEAIGHVMDGGDQPYDERALREMVRNLPLRAPLRPRIVSASAAADARANRSIEADADISSAEYEVELASAQRVLSGAMHALPAEDRLLVSMRFMDGQSVADIARALGLESKPLYARLDRALRKLRAMLEGDGVTRQHILEIISESES